MILGVSPLTPTNSAYSWLSMSFTTTSSSMRLFIALQNALTKSDTGISLSNFGHNPMESDALTVWVETLWKGNKHLAHGRATENRRHFLKRHPGLRAFALSGLTSRSALKALPPYRSLSGGGREVYESIENLQMNHNNKKFIGQQY